MNTSIRSTRFTVGMVLFLGIILLLSVSSIYYLNLMSGKTDAILKENHYSVVYAQDMAENLTNINQAIIKCLITNKSPDSLVITKEFMLFNKSLELEKINLTEQGEDRLVSGIENDFIDYRDSVVKFKKLPDSNANVLSLQKRFNSLYQQLVLLSQMNEKAIEEKTDDAKVSARKATFQMTFIGTLCFLIAYGFTFVFTSYFNEQFFKLYNGIKEIVSSNYSQRLNIDGNDEISEISMAINEMAEIISSNKQKMAVNLQKSQNVKYNLNDNQELKNFLLRIKSLEGQAIELFSRLEKK